MRSDSKTAQISERRLELPLVDPEVNSLQSITRFIFCHAAPPQRFKFNWTVAILRKRNVFFFSSVVGNPGRSPAGVHRHSTLSPNSASLASLYAACARSGLPHSAMHLSSILPLNSKTLIWRTMSMNSPITSGGGWLTRVRVLYNCYSLYSSMFALTVWIISIE